jgi:ankyrin repeat protein
MGLPQASDPTPTQPQQQQPSNPSNRPQLPPEALELASKLFDFARAGDVEHLLAYITAGIPANLTNHKGDTLLMLAAYHGNAQTVRMLIEKGADVNAINDRGQSPIAGAVFKGYDEVVKVLVEEGRADVHAGQPSAVQAAHMFKREECLRMFGAEGEEWSIPQ